jgi:hypothetical protein
MLGIRALGKACFGATPKPASETDALSRKKQTGRFFITSYLQLRELDLLGLRGHRRIIQLSFFFSRRSFCCSRVSVRRRRRAQRDGYRMRWTGQIFWLLAYVPTPVGITFFPPSPFFCGGPECFRGTTKEQQAARLPLQRLAHWEVVSSYSSATAPDSHGISCADPLFQARKELD